MTRVLITGALGLLGGALASRLPALGCDVRATGRRPAPRAQSGVDHRVCDLADAAAVRTLFDGGVDVVIHAAARLRADNAEVAPFVRDNVLAPANVIDAAREARAKLFILFSTIAVYSGDGPFTEDSATTVTEAYGWTKRAAEEIALAHFERSLVLRLAGLHGAPRRDGVIANLFGRAIAAEPMQVSEPDTRVTPTFVDDVVDLIKRLLDRRSMPPSRIYNLATSEAPSYRELAERVRRVAGTNSAIVSPPAPKRRNRVLDTSRIRAELGFEPAPLDEHLRRFHQTMATARA